METTYKHRYGTAYHIDTSNEVIEVLERCRLNNIRIVLDYGDTETGKSWEEDCDVVGRVGRSNGSIKIPILLRNSRSTGGCHILDHCIIGIKESKGGKELYKLKQ